METQLISGDIEQGIKVLKGYYQGDIVLLGSSKLASSLAVRV
ncbi:hypothetical protein [Cytobacillus purgationiresistens]|uniref:Uncharacterized protein n=1 Tax=Cytobacillus purgationiresistens TaxID=863449 RepID=A0ABU0AQ65_9BACI|nr:hypothetical protein [Cytobacillus purgationiresistens]MDQ0272538.1 hypothetical protein [Cytobacillus purgationiresistens]